MFALSKIISCQLRSSLIASTQRSVYSAAYFKIDKFENYVGRIRLDLSKNYDQLKSNIQKSFDNPESKIFLDDLKNLLYLTRTDVEFEFLLKAIEKYNKQDKSTNLIDYSFGTPLVRLAYTLNKTNEILNIVLNEEKILIQDSPISYAILMQKLFEEKKYQEVIKVFYKSLKLKLPDENGDSFKLFSALTKIYSETLLNMNSADAIKELINAIAKLKEEKIDLQCFDSKAVACLSILALQQEKFDLAYEISSIFKFRKNDPNLKIIGLSVLNKPEEAISLANQHLNTDNLNKVFSTTLDYIRNSVEKSNKPELKKELEALVNEVQSKKKLFSDSLKEYATKLIEPRPQMNMNQNFNQNKNFNRSNRNFDGKRLNRNFNSNEESNEDFGNRESRYNNENRENKNRNLEKSNFKTEGGFSNFKNKSFSDILKKS